MTACACKGKRDLLRGKRDLLFVCIYRHIRIWQHVHVNIQAYAHVHVHTYLHIYMQTAYATCWYTYVTSTYINTPIYIHTHTCTCVHTCICTSGPDPWSANPKPSAYTWYMCIHAYVYTCKLCVYETRVDWTHIYMHIACPKPWALSLKSKPPPKHVHVCIHRKHRERGERQREQAFQERQSGERQHIHIGPRPYTHTSIASNKTSTIYAYINTYTCIQIST